MGRIMVGINPPLTSNQEAELQRLSEKHQSGKLTEKQIITLGDLLNKKSNPRDLTIGVKNYLQELHVETLFARSKHITNKNCEKGINVEEQSLTLYTLSQNKFLQKNKERFNNDFITGEPDNKQGIIRDIKSSWDFSTFPFHDIDLKNKTYYWQMQGYMWLTGLKKAEIAYCLVDTPFKNIDDELRRLDWKFELFDGDGNINEDRIELVVETVSNLIYTKKGLDEYCNQSPNIRIEWFTDFKEVDSKYRIKIFEIDYNEADVELMKVQITKCREYMNELQKSIN
ncbi:hypothetical protein K5I29_04070 [Flavobacterium agricola]|uniref:YqaJ-like recombinase protein n=1 Tax=Flavobacterium agricola TaxID=2870839 RepID=A0ABY6M2T8_9FLAO|nr:hypothetical protein [Flavobacterium agricola]UYW02085.1 hypothetical protein K5I29_04070 [Flavobacterium agricola]